MESTPCVVATASPAGHDLESRPLTILSSWPRVEHALRERGVVLEPLAGETPDRLANRIGTRLMAMYRDTRCPECFEALYAVTGPAVFHWIRGLLHRGIAHLDPGELLQDTFVNVYRYREEHAGSFRVWVRTIAGNIVRRASGRRSRISFQELPEGLQEPQDDAETPELQLVRGEQEENLRSAWILFLSLYAQAWEELSQRDRRTLHLVEVENRSYQEAGRILGVGRSNMKMIVFRSRKRIARHMRAALGRTRPCPVTVGAA